MFYPKKVTSIKNDEQFGGRGDQSTARNKTAKEDSDLVHNNTVGLKNKGYGECSKCKALIIIDKKIVDEKDGKVIPLTLGGKRHHCNGTELILAEEDIVKEFKEKLDRANDIELSSFQIDLVMKERGSIK
jgi:hypothetical protein